jgi:hypothetical protein
LPASAERDVDRAALVGLGGGAEDGAVAGAGRLLVTETPTDTDGDLIGVGDDLGDSTRTFTVGGVVVVETGDGALVVGTVGFVETVGTFTGTVGLVETVGVLVDTVGVLVDTVGVLVDTVGVLIGTVGVLIGTVGVLIGTAEVLTGTVGVEMETDEVFTGAAGAEGASVGTVAAPPTSSAWA